MTEEFDYTGMWWLPDNSEGNIMGTLRFTSGEGAVLELMGSFEEIKSTNSKGSHIKSGWIVKSSKLFKPEIILGTSSDGKNITLHKCSEEPKRSDSTSGFPTSSFYANRVLIGFHFTKPEDLKFKSLSVNYPFFEEWRKSGVFSFRWESGENFKQYEVKYKAPEPVKAKIAKFRISLDHDFIVSGDRLREVNLKHTTFIKIEPEGELHFEEYQNILYHLQNFLSLATTRAIYPLSITATTEKYTWVPNGEVRYLPIKIFDRVIGKVDLSKELTHSDMLFTFDDISGQFEAYLQNWFGKAESLKPVYDLFFGTLYNPSMYLESKFLSLIQAIESFHRRRYGGEYLSDEDYAKVRYDLEKAIPDSVEGGFKDSLKSKIKYGNEFTLRTRLKEFFDEYQENLSEFIENKNAFIGEVVDTRNYLTHYDKKGKAAIGEELFPIIQKLKILLEICLLIELGFSSEKIKKLFSRNRKYQHEYIQ
jgi:hypothetical protein